MSLQMANSAIKTEEALAASEMNLEAQVDARTAELEEAQAKLIDQARESAVSDERQRIARDLHDDVTQTIYSASLIAEVLPQVSVGALAELGALAGRKGTEPIDHVTAIEDLDVALCNRRCFRWRGSLWGSRQLGTRI